MTIRRLASIFLLISVNLLIGIYYLQVRRPLPLFNNNENETVLWNANDSHRLPPTIVEPNVTALVAFPHPYQYIINNKAICSQGSNAKGKITLLVLVCSAVHNLKHRRTIRETWAYPATSQNNTGSVRLGFLLGATNNSTLQEMVRKESNTYSDVIQEDFYDSYWNLTIKSVMLLKWVNESCPNVHFVLKTDDDMYVNIVKLLSTLAKMPVKHKVMYGTLFRKAKPNRNPTAKWYVPKEQFRGDMFPDYLSGTGYVISRDVIPALYEISSTLPFLVMEDVFITGLCASEAGIRRYNVKGFVHWKRSPTGCAFKDAITGHHVSVTDMRKIWVELRNNKLTCPPARKGS